MSAAWAVTPAKQTPPYIVFGDPINTSNDGLLSRLAKRISMGDGPGAREVAEQLATELGQTMYDPCSHARLGALALIALARNPPGDVALLNRALTPPYNVPPPLPPRVPIAAMLAPEPATPTQRAAVVALIHRRYSLRDDLRSVIRVCVCEALAASSPRRPESADNVPSVWQMQLSTHPAASAICTAMLKAFTDFDDMVQALTSLPNTEPAYRLDHVVYVVTLVAWLSAGLPVVGICPAHARDRPNTTAEKTRLPCLWLTADGVGFTYRLVGTAENLYFYVPSDSVLDLLVFVMHYVGRGDDITAQ